MGKAAPSPPQKLTEFHLFRNDFFRELDHWLWQKRFHAMYINILNIFPSWRSPFQPVKWSRFMSPFQKRSFRIARLYSYTPVFGEVDTPKSELFPYRNWLIILSFPSWGFVWLFWWLWKRRIDDFHVKVPLEPKWGPGCFDWNQFRPCFGGLGPFKNRGKKLGSRYLAILRKLVPF